MPPPIRRERRCGFLRTKLKLRELQTVSDSSRYVEQPDPLSATRTIERLKLHLKAVPDVRRQRVQELRQAIREGRFVISPERIAEAMLASSLTTPQPFDTRTW